ncbi:choice-of-anchor D domain-containing protein [Halococcus sediminicola]|uniref:choice-of-anchor D domain-containing protein n=1 Tax=Halococcus sediminicola TaxID=1264579 RepID=UPI000A61F3D6|nr:choice-of-anchor D domain-containing protein [Halococcus sediminicola]
MDLVFGAPIKQFGDDEGTYADDRLIRFAHGDSKRALTRHSGNLTASNESYTECIESREITVKDGTATTTVTIRDGCNVPLSLVSYRKPGPGWSPETEPDQTFVDADSATLGPGTHTFSVALPDAYDTTSDRTAVAGDSATFGENVTLGPGVVVGDNATVASETSVSHRTLLGRNVTVGSGVTIGAGVIVSRDVSIGDGTQIGSGTRIGSGVSIGQNVLIGQNVKIRPGVSIDDGATIPSNTTVDSDVSGTDEGVTPSEPTAPPSTSPAMPTVPGSGSQSPTAPQTESPGEPEPTATATAEPAPTATDTTTASPDTSTTTQPSESTTQPPSSTRTETSTPTESPPSTSTETVPTTASTTTPSDTTTESPTTNTATVTSSPTAEQPTETGTATETATQSPGTPTTAPNPTSTAPTTTPTPTASPTATATATPPTDTTTTSTPPATTNPSPTTEPTETVTSTTTATTPITTTQTTTTTPPTETTTPEPPGSPNIALSPATSDYGETLVGTNGTQTFTITNDGDSDLAVAGSTLTGSNADQFEITDGGGSFTLAPGDSHDVTVRFSPTATGQQTATLDVASDDPDSPTVSSTLSGTGVQPTIGLTPTEHEYGSVPVDSGDTQTFTVTNDGTAPLSVTATRITGADADQFTVTAGGGQFTLAPGESHEVRVRFGPTSAGAKNAALEVVSEAADGGVLSAALSGTGSQSNIVVEPASLAYGDVSNGDTSTQTFTVTNDGDAPLDVTGTSVEGGAGEFTITDNGGPFTLAPGESREVTVQFAPTSTGAKNANVVVESDDGDQPTVTVPVAGSSVAPGITISPTEHEYGDVATGSTNVTTFTVTNDGTAPLSVSETTITGPNAGEFAITDGSGAFTLAPGESREIRVRFAPTSVGAKSATLAVDNNAGETLTAALSGTGTQSNVAVDSPSHDYGEVPNDRNATQTFTITNDGNGPLSASSVTIAGMDPGSFTILSGGGAFDLEPGESREIEVRFAPTTTGDKAAQLVVESDNADQPTLTIPLRGTSTEPDITLTPDARDYGDVPVESAETRAFVVRNDGSAPLSVSDVTIAGADAGEFTITDGGGSFELSPNETRTITVAFSPTSTGAKSATLEVASDDADSPTVTGSLTGQATQSNIAVDPASLDYGDVSNDGQATQTVTVTNDGDAPLSVSGATISGRDAGEFTITDGGGPFTLAPGESREVTVQFAPSSTGDKTAEVVIESDDADQPTVTVPLSGGSVEPNAVLTPETYDYGDVAVGSGDTQTFTVTNDGTAPLDVSGTRLIGADADQYTFVSGDGSFTLAPDESREVTVAFAPTSTGAKNATLAIDSDDPDSPTLTSSLSGTGTQSNIVVDPTSLDYGEVPDDGESTRTFLVTNDGTAPLSVSGTTLSGADAGEFTITDGGGPFTLGPGESREVTVQFAPSSTGSKSATLAIDSDDGDQPTVTVSLAGESVAPNVALSPSSNDYGEIPTGSANTTTFTVTNDGTAPLDVSGTSITGADAAAFTVVGGGGAFTLGPGESRELTVEFAPESTGTKSARLEVRSNDPDQPTVSSDISGTGIESNIAVDPANLDYGDVVNDGNATQTVTVTNDGTAPLAISGTSIGGDDAGAFTITDGGGPFTLAPGESQEVTVQFAPTTTGEKNAQLVVESDDPDQPTVTVPLTGQSVKPTIGLSSESYDYGDVAVNTGNVTTFTVTNDGNAPLTVSGTTISGANAEEFALVDGGRSYMLAPGESRDIRVRFVPNSTGAKSATLELESDDPDRPTVTAALTGTGTASNIVVDPPSYDYRQVPNGGSQTKNFTVTNDGDAPLSVSSTSIVGPDAGDFTIVDGSGPFTLQPGESQSVEVRIDFAPTTTGEKKATLVVESDAANQPTVTVPLSGESIAPSISLTPETRDLGEVPAGSVNTTTFTVTNDGTAGLDVSAVNVVGADASEFTVIGPDAPFTVEPGQSREITVEFAPGSAGAKSATIEVQSNDPEQSTVTAALTGTGTASNLVADPARHDFGEVATGTTNTTTITVTNDGSAPLAVTDTSIVGANGEEFSIVDGGGPFTLAPGEVREITVGFSPTSAGPKAASLAIESDAVNQQAVTIPLSGSGFVPRCSVEVSDVTAPDTVTRGEQATVTANVTNTGRANGCTENATLTAAGQSSGKVDVVFLLDDSGSMQPYIDQVRDDIRGFNNELDSQGIDARFAVVTYGKGSATLRQDYTSDVGQTERTIDGISASGAFEANYRAIRGSLNALSARSDAKTVLIDITNEDSDRISSDPTQDELVTLIDDKKAKLISVSPDVDYIRNYNNRRGEAYDPALDLRVLAERVADGAWFDLLAPGSFTDKFTNEVITSVGQNVTDEQSVTLDAGESQEVTFTIDTSTFKTGEIAYSVTVNASTRTGRITVE